MFHGNGPAVRSCGGSKCAGNASRIGIESSFMRLTMLAFVVVPSMTYFVRKFAEHMSGTAPKGSDLAWR